MNEITTRSTSRTTAQVSDLDIRGGANSRLVFRGSIVDNTKKKDASVRGVFLYQKKKRIDEWVDFETIPLNSVKTGEGYKLELKSAELLALYNHIGGLRELHSSGGVPKGQKKYVQVTPELEAITALSDSELKVILDANSQVGSTLLKKLLDWACGVDEPIAIVDKLAEVSPESLASFNAAVGLKRIKNALHLWYENKDNDDEEFWQKSLTENSFVLEHLYTWPTTIVKDKAYVGGKSVFNKGGNFVDYLVKNGITNNAALIEIKTPSTRLIGSKYRNTYNISTEFSGSIMQVLNYKHSLQESYRELTGGQGDIFDAFSPQCAVIIGNARKELDDREKVKAFEIFRSQLQGVNVFTFDELVGKTQALVKVMESPEN